MKKNTQLQNKIELENGISLEFLVRDSYFLGLGAVEAAGCRLRNPGRPMFVDIRNPWGVEMLNYRVTGEHDDGNGGIRLDFEMDARASGSMEWMVHEVRSRYNLRNWDEPPRPAAETRLSLHIAPVNRRLGQDEAVGFSYRYEYQSRQFPVYRLLDQGSWEIGGRAIDNEIWMRNAFSPSVRRIDSANDLYSTEWYAPTAGNPSVFQFLPLQTELQGFTFTASPQGVLVTWATTPAHVRSLIEKTADRDEIGHFHEHCGDLESHFETAPMEVLFLPGHRDRTQLINLYEAVRELVHETLHQKAGLNRERVTTYGMIEEWTLPDFDHYRQKGLPALHQAEVKTVGLPNHFRNNMNTFGVQNMCCVVDLEIADAVGPDKFRAFCRQAAEQGAKVEMWANTAISTLAWMISRPVEPKVLPESIIPTENSLIGRLKKIKSPFVRNPSGAIEADHYTPVFAVLNLRQPEVLELLLGGWQRLHDEMGVQGFFLDSSFNLSSDKFHYQPAVAGGGGVTADQTHLLGAARPEIEPEARILSQYPAHLEFVRRMQQAGIKYCNEDLGVFGVHRHGPAAVTRLDSLHLWSDCLVDFDPRAIRAAGAEPDDVFFRALAYRMMWMLHWDPKKEKLSFRQAGVKHEEDVPGQQHLELLRLFNQVESDMVHRTVLENEGGVHYRGPGGAVLWAFADLTLPLPGKVEVHDLTNDTTQTLAAIQAKPRHLYWIDSVKN